MGRRTHRANTRNGHETRCALICLCPVLYLFIETPDLFIKKGYLLNVHAAQFMNRTSPEPRSP